MEQRVIHISEMLRQMNDAMARHQQVNLKAWRIGRNANDPHRGELRSYRGWYVTSHTPSGRYRLDDPLSNDPTQRRRMVCEALISEFMGKRVIWYPQGRAYHIYKEETDTCRRHRPHRQRKPRSHACHGVYGRRANSKTQQARPTLPCLSGNPDVYGRRATGKAKPR